MHLPCFVHHVCFFRGPLALSSSSKKGAQKRRLGMGAIGIVFWCHDQLFELCFAFRHAACQEVSTLHAKWYSGNHRVPQNYLEIYCDFSHWYHPKPVISLPHVHPIWFSTAFERSKRSRSSTPQWGVVLKASHRQAPLEGKMVELKTIEYIPSAKKA